MADAVGLWVIVYFCVTSVNTKDGAVILYKLHNSRRSNMYLFLM